MVSAPDYFVDVISRLKLVPRQLFDAFPDVFAEKTSRPPKIRQHGRTSAQDPHHRAIQRWQICAYCDDDFDPNDAAATIGIDYRVKRLSVRGKTYRITLLDTAGQERFRTLSTSYYRGAHAIVFVYDVTNRATFDQMDNWFAEAEANTAAASEAGGASARCHFCLVGSKLDRAGTSRAVSFEEGGALAAKYHDSNDGEALFFETSARTGENVREPFVALVDRIVASGAPTSTGSRRNAAGTVSLNAANGEDGGSGYLPSCAC